MTLLSVIGEFLDSHDVKHEHRRLSRGICSLEAHVDDSRAQQSRYHSRLRYKSKMCRLLVFSILSLVVITSGFGIQPRIINGIESAPSEFPFYVHVRGNSNCGGSLISDKYCNPITYNFFFHFGFNFEY